MSDQAARPAQATLAAGLIIGGALITIVTSWLRMGDLHSAQMQEQMASLVRDLPSGSLGVNGVRRVLQVLATVDAAAAAACAILGFHVLKRSRSARIALAALAPVVVIGLLGAAGGFEPLVLIGIVMLWAPPTSDWYAGRDWTERYRRIARPDRLAPRTQSPVSSGTGGSASPYPLPDPAHRAPERQTGPVAVFPQQLHVPRRGASGPRPAALLWACIATWVGSVLTAIALVAAMVWVSSPAGDDVVHDSLQRSRDRFGAMMGDVTEGQVRAELYAVLALLLLWCVAACVLAGFALIGHRWARILLTISAIVAAVMCALGGLLGAFPLLLVTFASATTARMLLRRDVSTWQRP